MSEVIADATNKKTHGKTNTMYLGNTKKVITVIVLRKKLV